MPTLKAMEFLDLSDANDDEKAEAMAIIGSSPVYGVEVIIFNLLFALSFSLKNDYFRQTFSFRLNSKPTMNCQI